MKYKVGDKVRVKSLDWYNQNKQINGSVYCGTNSFCSAMSRFCGLEATISRINKYSYQISIDEYDWTWTDEMFEENIKNEIEFIDITNELYRVYCFENGCEVRINNPTKLNVSKSGGHRILDAKLISHYIPYKWNHLYWEPKSGCNNFVK